MKLILIRHAKVDLHRPKRCTPKEFDEIHDAYNHAPIHKPKQLQKIDNYIQERFKFYASTMSRSQETLKGLFGDVPFRKTELLVEVPNQAVLSWNRKISRNLQHVIGGFYWFLNSEKQKEGRTQTKERALKLIRHLEKQNEDAILVSHEFFMYVLLSVLKRRGYKIKRKRHGRIKNLECIMAVKA